MIRRSNLLLVDGDVRRRAAISHCLAGSGLHVEPFEEPRELFSRWPGDGVLLVHDSDNAVGAMIAHMSQTGDWLPVIAFAEHPDTPIGPAHRRSWRGVRVRTPGSRGCRWPVPV